MSSSINKRTSCLITTLGTEPQVVTSTIDLLSRQDPSFREILIIHTSSSNSAILKAITDLRQEFDKSPYREKYQANFILLHTDGGAPVEDVATRDDAYIAFRAIYRLIKSKKAGNLSIHFSISGGRKTLALYGLTAAQLLFDENDQLWYLFSAGEFLSSKRMHPQLGDNVTLVNIPVISWGNISPAITDLKEIEDPFEALERIQHLRLQEKYNAARTFILGSLSPAERKVVEILVKDGLSDYQIGQKLFLSPRTVEQHLRSAYLKAANHWEVEKINRSQLITLLQYFFLTQIRENPQDTPTIKS